MEKVVNHEPEGSDFQVFLSVLIGFHVRLLWW